MWSCQLFLPFLRFLSSVTMFHFTLCSFFVFVTLCSVTFPGWTYQCRSSSLTWMFTVMSWFVSPCWYVPLLPIASVILTPPKHYSNITFLFRSLPSVSQQQCLRYSGQSSLQMCSVYDIMFWLFILKMCLLPAQWSNLIYTFNLD